MLTPIDASHIPAAIELLARGFPSRPKRYWAKAFHNLQEFGGNARAEVPIGYLLQGERGAPSGVVMTPASIRVRADGSTERIVNLASWYVEPEHRWRAPVMMRAILRQPGCVFTDLTPTESVQQMLLAFGFRQLTAGVTVNLLAVAALRGGPAEVTDIAAAPPGAIDAGIRQFLEAHIRFGCLAAAIQHEDGWQPLLFKCRRFLKLPAALLIYSENNTALYRKLGAVARYLLGKGRLLLVLDMPLSSSAPGFERRYKTPRFAKGGSFEDRTDHAGSELALFDW